MHTSARVKCSFRPKREEEVVPSYVRKDPDAPPSDDYYNRDKPRAPKFTTHIRSLMDLTENQPARFECKLVPVGDPDLKVEWFKDGVLLKSGLCFFRLVTCTNLCILSI